MKTCTKCGVTKELSEFSKNALAKDGLQSRCKQCQNQYGRKWHEANKEKVKEKNRKYYKENPEKMKERVKKWREENPEKEKKRAKKWREENPGYQKKWREENLEKVKEYDRSRTIQQYGISLDTYNKILEHQGGGCAICGTPPNGRSLAVDHCHETSKVRGLLCSDCNTSIGKLGDTAENVQRAVRYLSQDIDWRTT